MLCRGRGGHSPPGETPSRAPRPRVEPPPRTGRPGRGLGRAGPGRDAGLPCHLPAAEAPCEAGWGRGAAGEPTDMRGRHPHPGRQPPIRGRCQGREPGGRVDPLSRATGTGTCLAWLPAQTAHPRSCRPVSASEGPQGSPEATGVARGCPTRGLRSCPPRAKALGQAVAWKGHRPPPAAAEGRSPISPLPRLVVLCCQPWLFVPSPPHLPYNRLTVSGTHSSGHPPTPPLAKNTRPKKLLSHLHLMEDGEETFPMQDRAFSSISLWGWSVSLAPTQATGSCCQLTVLW